MLGKGWTGSFCRYFRENVLPLAPVLEKAVCEEGPPQEPGAHEEETLNPRAGALRFGPAESPGFQWVLTLFSGQRYPNTFQPGLRGYFVTTGASANLTRGRKGGNCHRDKRGGPMNRRDNPLLAAELTEEQNGNMLDGILNNLPPSPLPQRPEEKELDRVKEPPALKRSREREER